MKLPLRRIFRTPLGILFFLTSFLCAAPQTPLIQDDSQTKQSEPPKPAEQRPKAIPPDEIPLRFESNATLLRTIASEVAPDPAVEEIRGSLRLLSASVQGLSIGVRQVLQGKPTLGQLSDLQSPFDEAVRKLRGWQSTLRSRSSRLEADLQSLRRDEAEWRLTEAEAESRRLPEEMRARITRTIEAIAAAEAQGLSRRNDVLSVQNEVADLRVQVDQTRDQIRAAAGQRRLELTSIDSPPLWHALGAQPAVETIRLETGNAFARQPEALRTYLSQARVWVIVQATLFTGLVLWFLILRRRAQDWEQDPDQSVRAVGQVIRRPLSSAILLATLAGILLHTNAPEALENLAWLLLLIPLLRVLPRLLAPEIKRLFAVLAALYVVERFINLLAFYSLAGRLLLLLVSLATAWLLIWMNGLLRKIPRRTSFQSALLFGIRAGILLASAALVCNIIGMSRFSRFFMEGLLRTLFAAVVIRGVLLIFRGFNELFLRTRHLERFASRGIARPAIERQAERILNLFGGAAFISIALSAFSLLDPIATRISSSMSSVIRIGAIDFTVGNAVTFGIVIGITFLLSRALRFVLDVGVFSRLNIQLGQAEAISKLTHYSVLFVGFLMAFSAAGVELSKFAFLAGAVGVGLGFGMQNIVNNFVSGLILLFERPVQVGDRITIGTVAGIVKDIGIRASTIRTWEGADVVLPNGQLISSELTNWTLSDARRRIDVSVGVAYGSDPDRIIELLKQVGRRHPKVVNDPEPSALFTGFGDSSLNFVLRCWADVQDALDVSSELYVAVNNALVDVGIEIPFPQRDLNVRVVSPEAVEAMRKPPAENLLTEAHPAQDPGDQPRS